MAGLGIRLFSSRLGRQSQSATLVDSRTATVDEPLNRLLRIAVFAGVESAVKLHIKRGDNLNARDANGLTPLMIAAIRNKANVVEILLAGGADPELRDPSGLDALSIAEKSGSQAVVALLLSLRSSVQSPIEVPTAIDPEVEKECDAHDIDNFHELPPELADPLQSPPVPTDYRTESSLSPSEPPFEVHVPAEQEATPLAHDSQNNAHPDLDEWEAEVEPSHTAEDLGLAIGAAAVQVSISNHIPIDTSSDWEDLETYLPVTAAPLRRSNDLEAREGIRLLLLRAIREGSVPCMAIEDFSISDDRTVDEDTESLLRMIVNDLGAEADERFEYSAEHEDYSIFVPPEESEDEEEILATAMTIMDDHASNRSSSLRRYQREFQQLKLLTASEEISIGKEMGSTLSLALDALAAWPLGVSKLHECAELARSGIKQVRWISSGTQDETPDIEIPPNATDAPDTATPLDDTESVLPLEVAELASESDPNDFFNRLSGLVIEAIGTVQGGPAWKEARAALESLSLRGTFLMDLADMCPNDTCPQAKAFTSAMQRHQHARERMASGNLKLAFSIAKKHLYSGIPLEDLAQEGNFGLLRAVDKYDWRKGYRFSTYATWWIRQAISRAVADSSRTIRVPVHVFQTVQKLIHESAKFERRNQRAPTSTELANLLDLPTPKILGLLRITEDALPIDEDGIETLILAGALPEYIVEGPHDLVNAAELHEALESVLSDLDKKQQQVIRMRFGIGLSDSHTLEEISHQYGVTRERIRQIEHSAMQVLKHPVRSQKLRVLLHGESKPPTPRGNRMAASDDFDNPPEISSIGTAGSVAKRPRGRPRKQSVDAPNANPAAKTTSLHDLLTQALEMGHDVSVGHESNLGNTCVLIKGEPDDGTPALVHDLLANGFIHWAGKGYWR